jgi:hypothetical protein
LKNGTYFRAHSRQCIKSRNEEKLAIDQMKRLIEIAKGNFSVNNSIATQNSVIDVRTTVPLIEIGFARTPPIIHNQFTTEQKEYLIKLFHDGEESGRKYNGEEASNMMLGVCDPLEPKQIRAFWSRYKKKLNDQKKNADTSNLLKIVQSQSPYPIQQLDVGISSESSISDRSSDDGISNSLSNNKQTEKPPH